jgi:hypothetical protein
MGFKIQSLGLYPPSSPVKEWDGTKHEVVHRFNTRCDATGYWGNDQAVLLEQCAATHHDGNLLTLMDVHKTLIIQPIRRVNLELVVAKRLMIVLPQPLVAEILGMGASQQKLLAQRP